PVFAKSIAAHITASDTAKWNANTASFEEKDPIFNKSVAAKISASDTAKWNAKLDNFEESDPFFNKSVASHISANDTAKWNAKIDAENDPVFAKSIAAHITASDTAKWNANTASFEEKDPIFNNSVAAKISASDTAKWNAKLDSFEESDPLFNKSVAAHISESDTANWNAKLGKEEDPIFAKSAAAKITKKDIDRWNQTSATNPSQQITEEDIQRWNAKVDSTTYLNSAAANITTADITNWNEKLDANQLPENVSAFRNDAEYITKSVLNDSLIAVTNRFKNTINSLKETNERLSNQIRDLGENYDNLLLSVQKLESYTEKIAQRALSYGPSPEIHSYPLKYNQWNYVADAYNALKDGDRIIFIMRHSIRGDESGKESKLTQEGIRLTKEVGAKLKGGKAGANDAFYGSTDYPRCMQTSFYIAQSRGDSDWKDSSFVVQPIPVIDQYFYSSTSDWDKVAAEYKDQPALINYKSILLINTLCEMSAGKTFAWFTTHDFIAVPLCSWASYGALNFARPNWINFLSGVAVIVHPDNSWEVYPIRGSDNGYGSVSWYR
ncbi:MAG: histidine phosphatase family protein, partial [Paludibacteraceae bacterium]|nr:histidine phosphatase family protein [Paludibacteraceae bacterium]